MKLVWSAAALQDRQEIFDYLFDRNPTAALKLNRALVLAAERLDSFPERERPGRVPGTRELAAVLPYLIICELDHPREVIRVWRTSQDRNF